jgi:hypothetical protein
LTGSTGAEGLGYLPMGSEATVAKIDCREKEATVPSTTAAVAAVGYNRTFYVTTVMPVLMT